MLLERIEALESKLKAIEATLISYPEWMPITAEFAKEHGVTINGLRGWCMKNIHPDFFMKKGRFWYIHQSQLGKIKIKRVKCSVLG